MIRFDLIPQLAAMVEGRACLAMPNVDISENDDGYKLSFEIPGTMKDDVKIWVENDLLTVAGEKGSFRKKLWEIRALFQIAQKRRQGKGKSRIC
jgi:HSP20 family molecular chaperone IbpA